MSMTGSSHPSIIVLSSVRLATARIVKPPALILPHEIGRVDRTIIPNTILQQTNRPILDALNSITGYYDMDPARFGATQADDYHLGTVTDKTHAQIHHPTNPARDHGLDQIAARPAAPQPSRRG
jgi:hypothetical protein